MHHIIELRKYVDLLVETNRCLALELDASRRAVGKVQHERDALRHELTDLRREQERTLRDWQQETAKILALDATLREVEEERDAALDDLEQALEAMDDIRACLQAELVDSDPADAVLRDGTLD